MKLSDNDFQILRLTDAFYKAYPNPPHVEILKKKQRAYNCILFQSHYDYFVCVPYRTEISHAYAYHFKNSRRARKHKSGLDYTKILIINKLDYIDRCDAIIDNDEFNETMINLEKIKREALRYVEEYVDHKNGANVLHPEEYRRRYTYSTLKYFHKELGL